VADDPVLQRLHLTRPIDGWFGDYPVRLIDVNTNGAMIEHEDAIPVGTTGLLRFRWRDYQVDVAAETSRTIEGQSSLRYVGVHETLDVLIKQSAEEVLRAQEANAAGDREDNIVGDETLTSASAGLRRGLGFLVYTYNDSVWSTRRSLLPEQPDDGFTVAAGETQEQIDMLCRTYERGDDEARQMTRMLAELSVAARAPKQ
jgi:hypothetical protein